MARRTAAGRGKGGRGLTVYIDLLFFLNLVVDYFILSLTARLSGAAAGFLRQLGGAAAGALFSFIIFLPALPLPLEWGIRLLLSALIILCAFGFGSGRRFLRLWLTFYAVSFLYAGLMLAVWFLFHPAGLAVHNGVVYFQISPLLLLCGTAGAYGVIWLGRRLIRRPAPAGRRERVEIRLGDRKVELTALVDTGHSLTDILSDEPVVVASFSAVAPLLSPESLPAFRKVGQPPGGDMAGRYRLIPYSVVGGGGLLPAFRCDGAAVLPAADRPEKGKKSGSRPLGRAKKPDQNHGTAAAPAGPPPSNRRETTAPAGQAHSPRPGAGGPLEAAAAVLDRELAKREIRLPAGEAAHAASGAPAIVAVTLEPLQGEWDAIISPELLEREKYRKRSRGTCI